MVTPSSALCKVVVDNLLPHPPLRSPPPSHCPASPGPRTRMKLAALVCVLLGVAHAGPTAPAAPLAEKVLAAHEANIPAGHCRTNGDALLPHPALKPTKFVGLQTVHSFNPAGMGGWVWVTGPPPLGGEACLGSAQNWPQARFPGTL